MPLFNKWKAGVLNRCNNRGDHFGIQPLILLVQYKIPIVVLNHADGPNVIISGIDLSHLRSSVVY